MTIDTIPKRSRVAVKAGRKSNAERAEIKLANLKRERYEVQESKRADKVQVDQNVVLWGWLIGVTLAFSTSAVISFNGITSVAALVGLTYPWMGFLFFGFIELAYVVFLAAYLILVSRGEKSGGPLFGMWFFAGISIASNAWHTLTFHNFDLGSGELWAGVVLSVSAPIAIISSTKLASRVVFAKAVLL